MVLQEVYSFEMHEFDDEGVNAETDQYFMELIGEYERDFHEKHPIHFANYLFANDSTMNLFNKALDMEEDQKCGMDLIDGEIDLETNMEIETYSDIRTVYAIGSEMNENEEPVFLIIDDKIGEGKIILKYIPDDDNSRENETPEIVVNDRIRI